MQRRFQRTDERHGCEPPLGLSPISRVHFLNERMLTCGGGGFLCSVVCPLWGGGDLVRIGRVFMERGCTRAGRKSWVGGGSTSPTTMTPRLEKFLRRRRENRRPQKPGWHWLWGGGRRTPHCNQNTHSGGGGPMQPWVNQEVGKRQSPNQANF